MNSTVLVLGAQGLLGRRLVTRWLERQPDAVVVGAGRSAESATTYTHDVTWLGRRVSAPLPGEVVRALASPRYHYARCDATDPTSLRSLLSATRPGVVVHAAAALRDSPWTDLARANVDSVVTLLECAAGLEPRPRVVLVSSGSVYGATDPLPYAAWDATAPSTLYGVSKRAGEDVARVLAGVHGIDLVRARVHNLVGPGLQDRHLPAVVAERVVAVRAGLADPVLSFGALTATRDFIDVTDAADAVVTLAHQAEPGRAYDVASGTETAARTLVERMVSLAGLTGEVEIRERAGRVMDVPRVAVATAEIRALGVPAPRPLDESLAALLDWMELVRVSSGQVG